MCGFCGAERPTVRQVRHHSFRLPLWLAQIVSPRNFGSGLHPLGDARLQWRIFGFIDTGRVLRYRIQTNAALRCLSPVGSPGIRGFSCTGHLVLLSTQQFVEPRHRGFRLTALADLWTLLVM